MFLGFGNGTFQDARLAMSGAAIYSIDADDSGDIVAAKYESNVVSVLYSNGIFSYGPQLPVGTNPSAVTSEDLDGVEDLAEPKMPQATRSSRITAGPLLPLPSHHLLHRP